MFSTQAGTNECTSCHRSVTQRQRLRYSSSMFALTCRQTQAFRACDGARCTVGLTSCPFKVVRLNGKMTAGYKTSHGASGRCTRDVATCRRREYRSSERNQIDACRERGASGFSLRTSQPPPGIPAPASDLRDQTMRVVPTGIA